MKKVIFVIGILTSFLPAFSQAEDHMNESRIKFGFNLGANYSNLMAEKGLPSDAFITNGSGFRLGLIADYQILDFLFVSPKTEMSFNNGEVNFVNPDGSLSVYSIMPISLDFMVHFIFKKKTGNLRPYLYFGPDFKIPVKKKSSNPLTYSSNSDLAIDFGIGLDKAFTEFHFAPEIRYSFGLFDVNQNPAIPSLTFHNVSVILNFI